MTESKALIIQSFCNYSGLEITLSSLIDTKLVSNEEYELLEKYFNSINNDLLELSQLYLAARNRTDDSEFELIESQYKEQLAYFWIEIQSEWIRTNSLANLKLSIAGLDDTILMHKATICSYFLKPIAEVLDQKIIEKNSLFLKKLFNRSLLDL